MVVRHARRCFNGFHVILNNAPWIVKSQNGQAAIAPPLVVVVSPPATVSSRCLQHPTVQDALICLNPIFHATLLLVQLTVS